MCLCGGGWVGGLSAVAGLMTSMDRGGLLDSLTSIVWHFPISKVSLGWLCSAQQIMKTGLKIYHAY